MFFVSDGGLFGGDVQVQARRCFEEGCAIVVFDPMAVPGDFAVGEDRMLQLSLLVKGANRPFRS